MGRALSNRQANWQSIKESQGIAKRIGRALSNGKSELRNGKAIGKIIKQSTSELAEHYGIEKRIGKALSTRIANRQSIKQSKSEWEEHEAIDKRIGRALRNREANWQSTKQSKHSSMQVLSFCLELKS